MKVIYFNFEYRFGDVLDLPYADKSFVETIKSEEKSKRNDFVQDIYYDLVTFICGLESLERNHEDVIIAIEQVFRSVCMYHRSVTYFKKQLKVLNLLQIWKKKLKNHLQFKN